MHSRLPPLIHRLLLFFFRQSRDSFCLRNGDLALEYGFGQIGNAPLANYTSRLDRIR